jgi:hypothetical protein
MGYVIQVCWQLACRIRTEMVPPLFCSLAVSKPVWHIPLLFVQWKTPDDGQKNCPKPVEFYSKNKFEKLVYLFGFIIRITWCSAAAKALVRSQVTVCGTCYKQITRGIGLSRALFSLCHSSFLRWRLRQTRPKCSFILTPALSVSSLN